MPRSTEPLLVYDNAAARDADLTNPQLLQAALLIDTGEMSVYYGQAVGWRPPWNTAWGYVAKTTLVTPVNFLRHGLISFADAAAVSLSSPTPPGAALSVPAGRRLRVGLTYANYELQDDVVGACVFDTCQGFPPSTNLDPGDVLNTGQLFGWWMYSVRSGVHTSLEHYDYATTTGQPMRLVPAFVSYANGLPASFSGPIMLSVEDVGPAANPTYAASRQ